MPINPVREHYLVYEPPAERFIAVVAVIRQGRDIPALRGVTMNPFIETLNEARPRGSRGASLIIFDRDRLDRN
jgi:hypothetical protein